MRHRAILEQALQFIRVVQNARLTEAPHSYVEAKLDEIDELARNLEREILAELN